MKRSNILFVLILILSVSLLNAARSAEIKSRETTAKPQQENSASSQIATSKDENGTPSATEHGKSETYEYRGNFNYFLPQPTTNPEGFWQQWSPTVQGITAILLAVFTAGLWVTSIWQSCAIERQANLAEEALLADVRPRLSLPFGSTEIRPKSTDNSQVQFVVSYTVKNTGRSPAYIVKQSHPIIVTDEPLPATPPEPEADTPIKGIIDGESEIEADARSRFFTREEWAEIGNAQKQVFLLMLIVYGDERGKEHRTRICSQWKPELGRWVFPRNVPDSYFEAT